MRAEESRARAVAEAVADPEMPMVTLGDLGVLRDVAIQDGRVVVTLTPTYLGCPAMETIKADVRIALTRAGFAEVELRITLSPAWSTDWITERGRQALREHGIAPPERPAAAGPEPVALLLTTRRASATCPRCGSDSTRELSRFGSRPCASLHLCLACAEPFDKVKEL